MLIAETKLKNAGLKGTPFSTAGHDIPQRGSWRTFMPVIDYARCIKCKMCWLHCPDSAYVIDKKGFPRTNFVFCKGCGICAAVCPVKCIKMERDLHRGKNGS